MMKMMIIIHVIIKNKQTNKQCTTWVIPWDKNVLPSKTNEQAVSLLRSSEFAIFKVSRRYFLSKKLQINYHEKSELSKFTS